AGRACGTAGEQPAGAGAGPRHQQARGDQGAQDDADVEDGVDPLAGPGQHLELTGPAAQLVDEFDPLLLSPLQPGDVAGEAAAVAQTAFLPEDVAVEQDVLDRAVLAPQPRPVVAQRLAGCQAAQDVVDRLPVGVKLGDGVADVLLAGAAKQVELGLVGPQDRPVRRQPVQADGGVLDEVGQLVLAPPDLLLGLDAVVDVHRRADVAGEAALGAVAGRTGVEYPAPGAVGAAEAVFHPEVRAGGEGAAAGVEAALAVVGVDAIGPAVAALLLGAAAGELQPRPVEEGAGPVGAGGPQQHGGGVGQQAEAVLGLAGGLACQAGVALPPPPPPPPVGLWVQ